MFLEDFLVMSFALTLPDGSKKEFEAAVSVADLAASISTSLGKSAVAAKVDGAVKPLDFELSEARNCCFRIGSSG